VLLVGEVDALLDDDGTTRPHVPGAARVAAGGLIVAAFASMFSALV
jgi:hypothetical protein